MRKAAKTIKIEFSRKKKKKKQSFDTKLQVDQIERKKVAEFTKPLFI